MTISRKLIVFLRALCTILGCLLFLSSLIFPFYHEFVFSPAPQSQVYFWSYKDEVLRNGPAFGQWSCWLSDFWFGLQQSFGLETSWMLMATFTIQLLTLALGLVSIRFNKRSLLFSPVLLSLLVAVLMTYTGEILGHLHVAILHAISPEFQVGYYLVYPSIALFLFAFLLNEVTKKQQTKDSTSV